MRKIRKAKRSSNERTKVDLSDRAEMMKILARAETIAAMNNERKKTSEDFSGFLLDWLAGVDR